MFVYFTSGLNPRRYQRIFNESLFPTPVSLDQYFFLEATKAGVMLRVLSQREGGRSRRGLAAVRGRPRESPVVRKNMAAVQN